MSVSGLKHYNELEIQYLKEVAGVSCSFLSKVFTGSGERGCQLAAQGALVAGKAPG